MLTTTHTVAQWPEHQLVKGGHEFGPRSRHVEYTVFSEDISRQQIENHKSQVIHLFTQKSNYVFQLKDIANMITLSIIIPDCYI